MSLIIYNTLTRRKEEFIPIEENRVRMYCCGPTVYDYFHIGNARTFVVFDVVRRYLEYSGYQVKYVQNITDIDDKIINRANEMGVSPREIAERYTKAYLEDSARLGIKPRPEIYAFSCLYNLLSCMREEASLRWARLPPLRSFTLNSTCWNSKTGLIW
ncbi:TPA: hypothetical protein EYP37_07890, partial [Candidatus Poribacteria bacterium]|nr:hypothetical protein [Candidatus Poribacteria bacterium]